MGHCELWNTYQNVTIFLQFDPSGKMGHRLKNKSHCKSGLNLENSKVN